MMYDCFGVRSRLEAQDGISDDFEDSLFGANFKKRGPYYKLQKKYKWFLLGL